MIDLRVLSEARLRQLLPAGLDPNGALPNLSSREPTLGALVVRETDAFLTTPAEYYEPLRLQWAELVTAGERFVVRALSHRIAARLGVGIPVVEPIVALVLLRRRREQPPRVREPAVGYRLAS